MQKLYSAPAKLKFYFSYSTGTILLKSLTEKRSPEPLITGCGVSEDTGCAENHQ